jgi:HPt (histidine-containing phosphotransfer) domain-containing protein
MDAYLTKPVRLAQLKSAIDAWLRPAPKPAEVAFVEEKPSNTTPAVDLSALTDLLGDDPQVMEAVLSVFRKSTRGTAEAMARAHASGEIRTMCDLAHKLKSGALSIGAARLGQVCAEIEDAAAGPDTEKLRLLAAAFDLELQAVQRYLDQHQGIDGLQPTTPPSGSTLGPRDATLRTEF